MRHAPYCHLWPVRCYKIFPRYLINRTIFETKKLLNIKYVFWFSVQLLSETFPILTRTKWDVIKNVYWSSCKVPVILVGFYSNWNFVDSFFFRNIKFHGHTPNGGRDVPSGRSDDDMTKLILAFRNFTNAPKTAIKINNETCMKKKQMWRIESR